MRDTQVMMDKAFQHPNTNVLKMEELYQRILHRCFTKFNQGRLMYLYSTHCRNPEFEKIRVLDTFFTNAVKLTIGIPPFFHPVADSLKSFRYVGCCFRAVFFSDSASPRARVPLMTHI
jgi:hypothetical protein